MNNDFISIVQAISSIVLVGITAWYAYLTRQIAKASRDQIQSSGAQLEIMQNHVDATMRQTQATREQVKALEGQLALEQTPNLILEKANDDLVLINLSKYAIFIKSVEINDVPVDRPIPKITLSDDEKSSSTFEEDNGLRFTTILAPSSLLSLREYVKKAQQASVNMILLSALTSIISPEKGLNDYSRSEIFKIRFYYGSTGSKVHEKRFRFSANIAKSNVEEL